ncbi:MAG: CehA/McbA family metallohydrolase, partial [Deltaproteobacteria bacterium]|nr:CehA/McbA family metallohydrolase [Deltaproteobacteria bacterium]
SLLNFDAPFSPILNFAKVLIGQYPQVSISAGQARAFRFFIGVGTGDTSSLQAAHAAARGVLSTAVQMSGTVKDPDGNPVAHARVQVAQTRDTSNVLAMARTDADGAFNAPLPPDNYTLYAIADDRTFTQALPVTLTQAGLTGLALTLGGRSTIEINVTEGGQPIAAKIVAEPFPQNARPNFPPAFGEKWARQPVVDFTATGHLVMPVYPGQWKVTVSHGFEYDVSVQNVTTTAGQNTAVTSTLTHVVDTTGWMSADFHIHAQGSPDADDLRPDKVRAFAGEGLEIPVSTEHEFIGDFGPTVAALGLGAVMHPIAGTELTTTAIGHFNIFPLTQQPSQPNMGGFNWYNRNVPDVLAEARARLTPDGLHPIVQMNHPRTPAMAYLDAVQFEPSAFAAGANAAHFTTDFDSVEVWNGEPLPRFMGCPRTSETWCVKPAHPQIYDWFAFLVRGKRIAATGDSDSHSAFLGSVGFPRTLVQVDTDAPGSLTDAKLMSSLRAQKAIISGGPFLMITGLDKNGATVYPGGIAVGTSNATGASAKLKITLQAPVWMGPMAVLDLWHGDVSAPNTPGKILMSLDLTKGTYKENSAQTLRLQTTVDVSVPGDDFIVGVVRGPVDANTGFSNALWPVVQTSLPPMAITNPIWIDANGDGVITPIVQ